eukprot:207880_1
MRTHVPSSIQPVLANWYLAFLLKGSIETGIFEAIPKEKGEYISANSICTQCNIAPQMGYKILRFMSSMGYTSEIKSGYFGHNYESLSLCEGGSAYYTMNHFLDADVFGGRLDYDSYFKGKSFKDLNGGQSILEFLENDNNKKRHNLFGTLMECVMSANEAELIDNTHFNFDKYSKVIDIGGGTGELLYDIVGKHTHIKGVVFEQPHCVDKAKQHWEHAFGINIDQMENMKYVSGDVLNENDVMNHCKDCDVIIMKRVLHDFDDDACALILTNIRKAMLSNTSNIQEDKLLLICDLVLSDALNDTTDIGAKLIDLEMGYVLNWKERRLSQFDALFNKHGFQRVGGYPKELANIHIMAVQCC